MNPNRNLVGRQIYNQASFAPSRGQNKPAGYIQRGIAQQALRGMMQRKAGPYGGVSRWGNDGQSDTRSGVAARALVNSPMGSNSGSGGSNGGAGFGPSNANNGQAGGVIPATNNTPLIKIGPDGTLRLPDDYEYKEEAVNRMDAINQLILEIQRKRQEEAMAFDQNRFNTEQEFHNTQKDTLSRRAGRGTVFSSGYGKDVRDNATKFNSMFGELDDSDAASQNRTTGAQILAQNDFRNFLRQLAIQQAFEAQQKAGAVRR